ncbi:Prolyl 4-hydroxylase alpha subunit [Penicillium malachiteum]|uniref:Prolyl 4-hydroxylase alpha subunit n=1 Tax=Penicillium malachiteum TaxID=1324776 RepID=A0AAD6HT01_9EURO|nr:Prolyl 4-hydroxylase alpha subunit [Penicillium malachiteum]
MSTKQNPDFLRGPPQNASAQQIDFTKTKPPIMSYKDKFAAVIENFMSESECTELLRLAEESSTPSNPHSPIWERAMINAGGGRQVMSVDTRKSGRIILDSPELAERITDRLMPFLRDFNIDTVHNMPTVTGLGPARRGETYQLPRINERLRFLRYEGGDYFRPHWDASYATPDGKERSLFTIHLYLNGDGEQDMEELLPEIERADKKNAFFVRDDGEVNLMDVAETQSESEAPGNDADTRSKETLLGGATSFSDGYRNRGVVRVFPKTGSLLIFQQRDLMHCGDDVFRGIKYTVRSDVMYTMPGQSDV